MKKNQKTVSALYAIEIYTLVTYLKFYALFFHLDLHLEIDTGG